jgi:entericidin B
MMKFGGAESICSSAPTSDSTSLCKGFAMIKKMFVTLFTMLAVVGAAATVTGCNTMEGAGKDVQQAGGAISDEARENK